MASQKDLEEICKDVYKKTQDFYKEIEPQLGDLNFGFKILYGPPKIGVSTLFIGFQPGGNKKDALEGEQKGERIHWSNQLEYISQSYKLAEKIKKIWDTNTLNNAVGLNYLFFRSPNKKTWETVDSKIRLNSELFCKEQAKRIVDAINPKTIVIIGFESASDFIEAGDAVFGDKTKLVRKGSLWGYPAFAVIHLSARVSKTDLIKIATFFKLRELNIRF